MIPDQNLIFLHLPKNGGTTLHSILSRWYRGSESFDIRVIDHVRLNTEEFLALPESRRNKIKLLKGHMQFGLHKYLNEPVDYITILREPCERIISFYNYVLRRPNHRLYQAVAGENMSLNEFVNWASDGDIHHGQVRWISGIDDRPELMYEKALENIHSHFSFVGILEQFDESVLLLRQMYGFPFPYYEALNQTKKRGGASEQDRALIREKNRYDVKLYEDIQVEFGQKLKEYNGLMLDRWRLKFSNKLYSFYHYIGKPLRKQIKN